MTQRVLCLNNSGARDRLTLGAVYGVVSVPDYQWLYQWIEVIDDKDECTVFAAARFTPTGTREEAKVRG